MTSSLVIIQSYHKRPQVSKLWPVKHSHSEQNSGTWQSACPYKRNSAAASLHISPPSHSPWLPQALGLLPSPLGSITSSPPSITNQSSTFTTDLLLQGLAITLGNECKPLQPSASLGCVVPFWEDIIWEWPQGLALPPQHHLQRFQKETYRR